MDFNKKFLYRFMTSDDLNSLLPKKSLNSGHREEEKH